MNESILIDTGKSNALDRMRQMVDITRTEQIRGSLEVTMKGMAKSSVNNYLQVLREDPLLQNSLRFNILTQRIDVVKTLWWNEEIVPLSDEGEDFLFIYFENYYGLANDKYMKKALRAIANSNKYHPICDYLNALEWDGEPRIRYVLKKYLGANDSELTYQCLLHLMLGAIQRVFHPGCKYEEMLVLVGGQGAGKSTFFRFLAIKDEWYSDDIKRLDDEKIYGKIRGHLIIEMPEMAPTISAKSIELIKAFLSRQKDTFRIPYQQYEEDRPRQCVFTGTTNTRQFIPFDRTGARRYLPIAINPEKAEKHLLEDEKEARLYFDQLWAEAMALYNSGNYSMKFSEEIQKELDLYRENFTQEDTTAGVIQGWLDAYDGDYVCSKMLWKEALENNHEPKKYETNEICEIMDTRIVGWKRIASHRFTKEGYGTQRGWVREHIPVNKDGEEEFRPLTEAEQLSLPFDKPDREKA